jgi:hypothetical protein
VFRDPWLAPALRPPNLSVPGKKPRTEEGAILSHGMIPKSGFPVFGKDHAEMNAISEDAND